MKRLIRYEILPDRDFSDFDTCVDCIKGKLTAKVRNAKIDRCTELLGVIHTDICESFNPLAMGGYKYFLTFIYDYSRYGFIELIHEKSKSLEAFKAFKAKVELQQGKRIKVVHYDKVVSNLVDMMRREATLDHLRGTFRNMALMLSL